MKRLFFWICLLGLFASSPKLLGNGRGGAFSFDVDQRFFNDGRFGYVNGFSEWWAPSFGVKIGIFKLPYRFEPLIGFHFIKNETTACVVGDDGVNCLIQNASPVASEDRFNYQIYTGSLGLRWKFWSSNFFLLVPYAESALTYSYVRIRKITSNTSSKKLVTGADLGAEFLAGTFISFFYDKALKNEMTSLWGITDFGMNFHIRYLPGGWVKQGMGSIRNSGGWSFGTGLTVDW